MIPLGDSPNSHHTPVVTILLIAANVIAYALLTFPMSGTMASPSDPLYGEYVSVLRNHFDLSPSLGRLAVSEYDLFVYAHGFKPAAPEVTDLFSSLFLHAGLMHLLGNMMFLWIYGDNVEHRLGPLAFLASYLAFGVVATLTHAAFSLDSPLPLVGASGSISGILGAYFVWFPHNRIRVLLMFGPLLVRTVELSARTVLGIYFFVNNFIPFVLEIDLTGGGVAYGAHLGGFVAGYGLAVALGRREFDAAMADLKLDPDGLPPTKADLEALIHAGDFELAARRYLSMPAGATMRILAPESSLSLAGWLLRERHPNAALTVFRRHLRDFPNGPGLATAHTGAGTIYWKNLRAPSRARLHFLAALAAQPTADEEAAARAALSHIER